MLKKVDHIGVAVKNVEEASKLYRDIMGLKELARENVPKDAIKTIIFQVGEVKIELMEPTAHESPIRKFLDQRGQGIHHICYIVDNLQDVLNFLEQKGVILVDSVPRIGLGGDRIAFVHPKATGGVLIELKELMKD